MPYEKVGKNEPVCIADEVPFEIPDSWEWVRHNDLFEISGGSQPPKSKFINEPREGYIRLFQIRDYGDKPIPAYIPESTATKTTQKGDILLARYGASLGKVFWAENGAYNVAMAKVVPLYDILPEYIYDKYLFYYYHTDLYRSVVMGNSRSAQAGFNKDDLKNMWFPIPPFAEQQRIVNQIEQILPFVDSYSENERNLINLNVVFPEQLKKSILQEAVQGKLVPQNENDEPASVLLERIRAEKKQLIKDGKIKRDKHESIIFRRDNSHYEKLDGIERCIDDEIPFDLPESWRWVRLGYLLKIESGKPLTAKEMKPGEIPVYGGNGITGYHNDYLVDVETVVIGRVGYYCGSVHVTKSKAWITDNAFITTYPTGYIDRDYLVFTLRSMNLGQNNNATAQPVVSGKKIYPMLFPLPPLEEQKRIVAKLKEILLFYKTI